MKRQDELNEAWCKYMGKCSTEILQALAFALRWCDKHPHWISVEDELPKDYEPVLAAFANHFARVCFHCGKTWYLNKPLAAEEMEGITHWMPLPAPPSGSSEIPNNCKKFDIPGYENVIIHEGNTKGGVL